MTPDVVTADDVAIRTTDLSRRFDDLVAVDGINLEVAAGELFGLVGPDGAGKTTTLRMLAAVLRPSSGDAAVLGWSVVEDPEGVKPHIAYMSQRFGLYADLTVSENLRFYADLFQVPEDERRERLERLYGFSNLGPFRDRLAGQLSGGMKQKLGLSCALIHQPRVLLLDEPTFGVDPISRRELWLIVHEMVAQGVTAVVSTAYMDEAERFDRVAFLDRGRVVALGDPVDLKEGISGELLAVRLNRVREARDALASRPDVRRAVVFGERLHVTVEEGARGREVVAGALAEAGLGPAEIEQIPASMEDVFIDRIGAEGS